MSEPFVFVSESATEGHPDKLCDRISDALVDASLQIDPGSRIDAECALANGIVFVGAHYRAEQPPEVGEIARSVIEASGYVDGEFNASDCTILSSLNEITSLPRMPDFDTMPGDEELDLHVARHQATVFGYACKQTPELMPLPIQLAHRLARELDAARRERRLGYLLPDAKTQVAVEYRGRTPARIHSVSLAASGDTSKIADHRTFVDDLDEAVVRPLIRNYAPGFDSDTRILVNHDGVIRAGGPALHSGLTGRKTAIDTYGGFARHSGAALSGKDPMRIDRLGSYAARHVAKNVVGAGLADECEVQISYTIGLAQPVGFHIDTFGTGTLEAAKIVERIRQHFELRPAGMMLNYGRYDPGGGYVRFAPLAVYGHVGREDLELPWERLDRVEALAA